MRYLVIIFLLLFKAPLVAQVYNQESNSTPLNAFASYGIGLEFNGGYSQSYILGVKFDEHLLSFRYVEGREWSNPGVAFGGSYVYPYRVIRSMSLMYNNLYSEYFRMGFGASLTRGNVRGETLIVDLSGTNTVTWHEDISYVTVGATYDLTAIPFEYKGLQIEVFLRGEVNFFRFYNTIGIGLGYTFPNF